MKIGVAGAGAMGSGIAWVAAQAGHPVVVTDARPETLVKARQEMAATLDKLVAKQKFQRTDADSLLSRISYTSTLEDFRGCGLVIEAIIENESVKKELFRELEKVVDPETILASNTSSLSITSIAGACSQPERVIGIHFFNPAPLMPLVEIIPALQTSETVLEKTRTLVSSWGKTIVVARDTPGFIVNRIARPFYGEALRIYEEGIAEVQEIDVVMRTLGGFRMGPFELMDLIGNDINYAVTESVFHNTYFDPRYKPSVMQKRMVEAGWLGRKSGRGYYQYPIPTPDESTSSPEKAEAIFMRILAMLINEAYDAIHFGVATEQDIETAMTRGVNYPKGLVAWSREIGLNRIIAVLDELGKTYGEDRYRCSTLLRQRAAHTNQ